ncbi:MAG: HAMP domain-containing sensor histidine kinase [Patescibacteria group bacterium]
MEKLYKQFVASVTSLKAFFRPDEFTIARIKLTFLYVFTAALIVSGASFLLYKVLLSNIHDSLSGTLINPVLFDQLLEKIQTYLQNRLLAIDLIIISFVVLIGFFLTRQTLKPIKMSAQKQKKFIADASHELRTPIAIVISGLEVALRNKSLDISKSTEVLQKSLEEMRELSVLSNNLLDISKYDNILNIPKVHIDAVLFFTNTVSRIQSLARDKGVDIKIVLDDSVNISVNKLEFERVVFNVLNNAITHTQEGGVIIISDKKEKNSYFLIIEDTGSGIPKELIPKVFDPFFRADESRNTVGAGLGLTLAKKIIDNHKGQIHINSEEGKGTQVVISIPISK